VTKEHIEKRIQRRIDAIRPAQVVDLRRIYASLNDEMSSPADWFEVEEAAAPAGASVTMNDIKAAAGKKKAPPPAPPAEEPAPGPTYAVLADQITKATDRETAYLVLDTARHLPADQQGDLEKLIAQQFPTD